MLPEHAPFPPDQRQALDSLLALFNPVQRGWLSGYLAASGTTTAGAPAAAPTAGKLTVVYGTESGNCEVLADRAVKAAKNRGFQAAIKNMSEISPSDLAKSKNLLVIVSTWGEGDAPESAVAFHKELMTTDLQLADVRYSVCALGDTSYERFCQIGKDVDARLEGFSATRVQPRQDCDLDYEAPFEEWLTGALTALAPEASAPATAVEIPAIEPISLYGKKNPFLAETLDSVLLNGEGTAKETLHVEFSLAGSGLTYEPGDALAVQPVNAPDVVQAIIQSAKLTGNETVDVKNVGPKLLADALREDYDVTALSRGVLTKLADVSGSTLLRDFVGEDQREQLKEWMDGREIIDALVEYAPEGLPAEALVSIFRKLPVRLYSIASSPLEHPDEVHLTVAAVRYETNGRDRKGVCSTYLADLVKIGENVPVFVQPNKNFRLPSDPAIPIIMVGPGTGVAPFRAFVEHRSAQQASGKSWLFFGDQHYTYDFLYQLEWQDHLKSGALTKLDVAFSRDQPEKIYVQDRIIEHSSEIYQWLQNGAHFYVCGDATRMARDVHEALISVVEFQAGISREAAEAYVEELKKSKRYQRDVY